MENWFQLVQQLLFHVHDNGSMKRRLKQVHAWPRVCRAPDTVHTNQQRLVQRSAVWNQESAGSDTESQGNDSGLITTTFAPAAALQRTYRAEMVSQPGMGCCRRFSGLSNTLKL